MDDYKKRIIKFVKDRPLLWDPQNPDYHNKEQRKQVWEDIDSKCLPKGTKTNSKAIWESLSRSFSNALRRKNKKPSGSEAGNDKEWKFQQDLMFLLPVKTLRKTLGILPGPDLKTTINYFDDDEDSVSVQSQPYSDVESSSSQEDNQFETEVGIQNGAVLLVGSKRKSVKKRKAEQVIELNDTTDTILEMMKQRQVEKLKESTRLNFFRSLLPSIDNLDEDQFLNFQMDVIQALQKQMRVGRQSGSYHQQQQSPTPSSPH